jgi:hypothetical protein
MGRSDEEVATTAAVLQLKMTLDYLVQTLLVEGVISPKQVSDIADFIAEDVDQLGGAMPNDLREAIKRRVAGWRKAILTEKSDALPLRLIRGGLDDAAKGDDSQ